MNYFAATTCSSFESLYSNVDNLLDSFAAQWAILANLFLSVDNVIGFDLLNEPWMGDIYTQPQLFIPGFADRYKIQLMYDAINTKIRMVDENRILFFEPVTWDYLPAGFSEGPGGSNYSNKNVLSYHIYCLDFSNQNMSRVDWSICNITAFEMISMRKSDSVRMNVGLFMSEWGGLPDSPNAEKELLYIANEADMLFQSWTYWAGIPAETGFRKQLSRPYAQAIAGTPILMQLDNVTREFILVFVLSVFDQDAPTELFLHRDYWYPEGVKVTVDPPNALSWDWCVDRVSLMCFKAVITESLQIKITIEPDPSPTGSH